MKILSCIRKLEPTIIDARKMFRVCELELSFVSLGGSFNQLRVTSPTFRPATKTSLGGGDKVRDAGNEVATKIHTPSPDSNICLELILEKMAQYFICQSKSVVHSRGVQ